MLIKNTTKAQQQKQNSYYWGPKAHGPGPGPKKSAPARPSVLVPNDKKQYLYNKNILFLQSLWTQAIKDYIIFANLWPQVIKNKKYIIVGNRSGPKLKKRQCCDKNQYFRRPISPQAIKPYISYRQRERERERKRETDRQTNKPTDYNYLKS